MLICQALCEALGLHQETKLVKIQALGEPTFAGRRTNNGGFSDSHFEAIWRPDLKTHRLQNLDGAGVEVQINPRTLISQRKKLKKYRREIILPRSRGSLGGNGVTSPQAS